MADGGARIGRIVLIGFTALVLLYLVMPTFVILPMSFSNKTYLSFPPPGWSLKWYQSLAERPDYPLAFLNSVKIGVPVALLATTLGTLAALGVVRGRFFGARPLSALVIAPLMLPQIILAIGLYPIMARIGLIGSYPAVVIGHTVICIPLVFITVAASLKSYQPTYELAAMTLGANWWQTFWHVTFPMIRIGVIVGAILSFTFSFDELIISLFLTSPGTRTLPRLLWEDLRQYVTPIVAAATTLVLCISFFLLSLIALIQRRKDAS
ncbi:MAG: ABC transporter permease [Alphaproteobacteria bacterium]|nr:ABC transporter permease [Alphaproteobacteria bacterium]